MHRKFNKSMDESMKIEIPESIAMPVKSVLRGYVFRHCLGHRLSVFETGRIEQGVSKFGYAYDVPFLPYCTLTSRKN